MSPRCGARTRQGGSCGQLPMANGRCRFHGGLSTGPRTPERLERMRAAKTVHGGRAADTIDYADGCASCGPMRAGSSRECETATDPEPQTRSVRVCAGPSAAPPDGPE
ncbi:MAG: HGGxSTG domain-containing protein [Janthinobacterium lividum]